MPGILNYKKLRKNAGYSESTKSREKMSGIWKAQKAEKKYRVF